MKRTECKIKVKFWRSKVSSEQDSLVGEGFKLTRSSPFHQHNLQKLKTILIEGKRKACRAGAADWLELAYLRSMGHSTLLQLLQPGGEEIFRRGCSVPTARLILPRIW